MAVIADDTTDVSNHLQNVVVFRYIVSGKIVERFWTFCDLPQGNAENIYARALLVKHTPMLIMFIAMPTNLILFYNRLLHKLTM